MPVDLRDFPMPFYDGDVEATQGLPPRAKQLKALMVAHDGFLIASPEYNSSITAVLKNTIDWISRPQPNEPRSYAFRGKVCALLAASPGNLGGVRSLLTVRQVLSTLGVLVLPAQFTLAHAASAFNDEGSLKEEGHRAAVAEVATELVRILLLLHAANRP